MLILLPVWLRPQLKKMEEQQSGSKMVAMTLEQAAALREISAAREQELKDLRDFSAMEMEASRRCTIESKETACQSEAVGRHEMGCLSQEQAEQGTQTVFVMSAVADAETAGDVPSAPTSAVTIDTEKENQYAGTGTDKSDRRELARLRAEMEGFKAGYELLKLTAMQEYLTKPGSDRKVLMEHASRIISVVDMGI